LLAWNQDDVSE